MTTVDELLAHEYPLALGSNADGEPFMGSCPCCHIKGDGFEVEVHCWRPGCEYGCPFSGIHVSGTIDRDTKQRIAEHIRDNNGWSEHTDWNIVIV